MFENISSALQAQKETDFYFNTTPEILTDDTGWYQRINEASEQSDPEYQSLSPIDCMEIMEIGGIFSTLLFIISGAYGYYGAKNLSIPKCSVVMFYKEC